MPRISGEVYNQQQVALQPLAAPMVDTRPQTNAALEFGQVAQQISNDFVVARSLADKTAATRSISEANVEFAGIIQNNNNTIPDPEAFHAKTTDDIKKAFDTRIAAAPNEQARQMIRDGLSDNLLKAEYQNQNLRFEKTKNKALGDFAATRELLNRGSVGADDVTQADNFRKFSTLLDEVAGSGYIDQKQRENETIKFNYDVIEKTAQVRIRQDAEAFLANPGAVGSLPLDTQLKLSDQAHKRIESNDRASKKITDQLKESTYRQWSGLANEAKLDPVILEMALQNKVPYITPDQARTLKGINDNPPTSEGNQAAMTTWSQYLSGSRSLGRIEKARAELNRIQADIGKPNKYIMDRLNELQSDTTTLENQGISRQANDIQRQNREINNIITGYEANKVDVPPFVERLLGNRSAQDKARIRNEYLKTKDPAAAQRLADQLSKGATTKANSIPQKMKNVMEYGGN